MLNYLFGGLTARPAQGVPLFDAVTIIARERHWYVEGAVADTLDGRFAMVATITALTMLRLEALGDAGNAVSVVLTERFVEVMEAEHREMGIGDPTLGKTVRKLVASLAHRVAAWRGAVSGDTQWEDAAARSIGGAESGAAHRAAALLALWARLDATGVEALAEGRLA